MTPHTGPSCRGNAESGSWRRPTTDSAGYILAEYARGKARWYASPFHLPIDVLKRSFSSSRLSCSCDWASHSCKIRSGRPHCHSYISCDGMPLTCTSRLCFCNWRHNSSSFSFTARVRSSSLKSWSRSAERRASVVCTSGHSIVSGVKCVCAGRVKRAPSLLYSL